MSTSVVGVDIGTTGIRAVEVQDAAKPRPRILRFAEVQVPEGAVVRGEVLEPQTVAAALKRMWATSRFSSKRVVLGMGNQNVLARDYSVPLISGERIRESLPFHVQDMLPVPVADALLDFYPAVEVRGESGPMADGLLIAAIKQAVVANVSAVEHARLRPAEVDLIPFALNRLLLTRAGVAGTAAVVDFGASCTTIVAAIDGIPRFMRMIPSGGAEITEALRVQLEVDSARAEQLKRTVALEGPVESPEEQRAREVIVDQVDELIRGVRNTVNYVATAIPRHPITHLHLCGGGSQLRGIDTMLTDMTGVPSSFVDPFASVAVSRRFTSATLRQKQWALTVALGLAVGSAA